MAPRSAQAPQARQWVCTIMMMWRLLKPLVAYYLAGAQLALVQWWLEQPHPHAADTIAQTFHRLQRAAVREAFELSFR
jgi:hypothetical protein